MDKQEEKKSRTQKGRIFNQDEGNFRTPKGKIEHIVDFLFTLPVINPDEKEGELMHSIYVDEKGDKHRLKKILQNSPQVIDCVEYGYKTWKEKNPNNNIEQWQKEISGMLNSLKKQSSDIIIKRKIDVYTNMVDLFVFQEKKEKEKGEKYSSVNERLYALKEVCPEFIDSLSKLTQAEKKELMQIITNSNGDNILKKLIHKNSPMDVDGEFEDKIQRFKIKLLNKKV